jgi:hypothetical protein
MMSRQCFSSANQDVLFCKQIRLVENKLKIMNALPSSKYYGCLFTRVFFGSLVSGVTYQPE